MEVWKKRFIALHHCPHISDSKLLQLFRLDPSLATLHLRSPLEISQMAAMTANQVHNIREYLKTLQIDSLLDHYQNNGIHTLTIFDDKYPPLLREIYDPPLVLYTKGNTQLMKKRCLGVVGTRNMTPNGHFSVLKLLPPLIKHGFVTVSGLAKGIDTLAHQITVKNQGCTIAVLGGGIMKIYPKENQELAELLSETQLLISEYPPFTSPKKWHFPKRNRIISGLSEGVIIIEAKEKSGSLITADQALEQGREVFSVPGSILEPTAAGTNSLIQQGAKLVLSHQDILNELRE